MSKYGKWKVVIRRSEESPYGCKYEVCRLEHGGLFTEPEEAEHIAYELNKEATE